ncbi:MAG: hypothetical protein EBV06_03240 [Planctomycetia bacterium]|nr:hypothetical protein [Planctomycetia bacterium]
MFDTEPKVIEQPFSRDPLPYITSFIIIFRSILWEALPFIVLGAVIAGLLEEFLPPWLLTYLIPRNPFLAVGIGGLLGIVFPICECGIVPIMRRLLRKGLPLSCCVAYLLAGPIVNIVVLLSTMAAFSGMENTYLGGQPTYQMSNWWMTGFRAGLGYIVAVVTGLLVEWMWRKHGEALLTPVTRPSNLPMADENGNNLHEKRSLWQRISNVSETALHDFVDITVFLILGAMLAAGSRMFLTPERIAELGSQHAILAIVLMMGLAVMLCLCSEADAFVAASFVTLQPSAKLSFLVLGPMLDFKLYAMYTVIFRPKLIMTIYIAVIGQVLVYSVATHYFWETFKTQLVTPREPESTVNDDELKESVTRLTSFVGILGGAPLASNPGAAGLLALDPIERVMEMSFLRLENAAQDANLRQYYLGKTVAMSGRFSGSDRGFMLVRYKYNCCAADAVPLQAYLVPDDPNKGVPAQRYQGKWVKVAGRIDFRPDRKGGYTPFIVLPITEKTAWEKIILEIEQPANPFIY